MLGSNQKRNELVKRLSSNNIPSVVYYKYPIHLMNAFKYLGYKKGDLQVSENLSQTIVSLPMHPYLTEQHILNIIESLKDNE